MKWKMPRRGGSGLHGSVSNKTFGACPLAHLASSGGKNKSVPGKPKLKYETFRWFCALAWSNQAGTNPARILLLPKIKTRVMRGIGGKDLALVHPLQLGVENHIGTNLQVREPPLECKGGDPNKGEDQQGPAKRRRGGPLAPVMELGGV
jgi:hypothetical protein